MCVYLLQIFRFLSREIPTPVKLNIDHIGYIGEVTSRFTQRLSDVSLSLVGDFHHISHVFFGRLLELVYLPAGIASLLFDLVSGFSEFFSLLGCKLLTLLLIV